MRREASIESVCIKHHRLAFYGYMHTIQPAALAHAIATHRHGIQAKLTALPGGVSGALQRYA